MVPDATPRGAERSWPPAGRDLDLARLVRTVARSSAEQDILGSMDGGIDDGRGAYIEVLDDRWPIGPVLLTEGARLTIGRDPSNPVGLVWDREVSRVHAFIERVGMFWTLVDDGISRNGTFVNGTRINGRWTLVHRDHIRVGRTIVAFHDAPGSRSETLDATPEEVAAITPAQLAVLETLCRPITHEDVALVAASTQAIADELHVSTETVRTHLKELFRRFALDDVEPRRKRAELARRAIELGVVVPARRRDASG